jgi:hypothetical protein
MWPAAGTAPDRKPIPAEIVNDSRYICDHIDNPTTTLAGRSTIARPINHQQLHARTVSRRHLQWRQQPGARSAVVQNHR